MKKHGEVDATTGRNMRNDGRHRRSLIRDVIGHGKRFEALQWRCHWALDVGIVQAKTATACQLEWPESFRLL